MSGEEGCIRPINKSRFCYSYKPPGTIDNCCKPTQCATNDHIALISSLPMVVNNSSKTSEGALLLFGQQQYQQEIISAQVNSTVQNTLANSTLITSTLYGQLLEVQRERYLPYQPYMPPVVPQSVIDLQMNTANVGVPHSFFTCADAKGVQFVTN